MEEEKVYKTMWLELMQEFTKSARYGIEEERNTYADALVKMADKQVKYLIEV